MGAVSDVFLMTVHGNLFIDEIMNFAVKKPKDDTMNKWISHQVSLLKHTVRPVQLNFAQKERL